jgi:uncharacterized membrane protein (DUF4010 family)
VVFAALFIVISVLSAWIGGSFGSKGLFALAAVVGTSDIDPFVLSIAQGGVVNMPAGSLAAAVLIAASSNNVVKAAMSLGFGGTVARRPAIMLLVLAALGAMAALAYVATSPG